MPWPFVNDAMPNAPRGGGGAKVDSGGRAIPQRPSYDPPKGPKGPSGTPGAKKTVHKSGSQNC
jgi:hypothetical protein